MSATRQGSASFTVVLVGITALGIGALLLTWVVYPMITAFRASAIWQAETATGAKLLTYVGGIWEFWGGFILLALLSFIWIRTRQ